LAFTTVSTTARTVKTQTQLGSVAEEDAARRLALLRPHPGDEPGMREETLVFQ